MTENTAPTEAPAKTVIRPKLANYVRAKSAGGKRTHRTDDLTARTLAGKDLVEIKRGAALLGIDAAKWTHLNPGQQRMLVGNAIRKLLSDDKVAVNEQTLLDIFGEPVAEYDAEKAAAEKAAADEAKAAKKAEKANKEAERVARAEAAKAAQADSGYEPTHSSSGKSRAGKK